jgi:hypothetical protein
MSSRTGINVDILQTKLIYVRNFVDNAAISTKYTIFADGSGGTYWSSLYIENIPGFSSFYNSTIGLASTTSGTIDNVLRSTTTSQSTFYGSTVQAFNVGVSSLSTLYGSGVVPESVASTFASLGTIGFVSTATLARSLQSTTTGILSSVNPFLTSSLSTITLGRLSFNIGQSTFQFLSSSKNVAGFGFNGSLGIGIPFASTFLDVSGSAVFRSPNGVYINTGGSLAINKPYGNVINSELDVSGNIVTNSIFCSGQGIFNGSVTAASYLTSSDSNYKTNINTYVPDENAWDYLRGVRFTWKESGNDDIGFIAQELHNAIPEAVSITDKGRLFIEPSKIIPLLVETVKELKVKYSKLEARLAALEVVGRN